VPNGLTEVKLKKELCQGGPKVSYYYSGDVVAGDIMYSISGDIMYRISRAIVQMGQD
jgi:hypothetical protein